MKELNEVDVADTPSVLDDSTREVLDDYSRKLLTLIQTEKERIRKQAILESDKIIAESERKARAAYDRAIKTAEAETNIIVSNCAELADKLTGEADRISGILTTLKEKSEERITELGAQLQQEAERLAESIRRTDKAVSEIKARINTEFTESISLVTELKKQLQSLEIPEVQIGNLGSGSNTGNTTGSAPPASSTSATREEKTVRVSRRDDHSSAKNMEKTFVGTLNLDVTKGTPALARRFREALAKVPGLEISKVDDSAKDKMQVVAFASRSVPLIGILQQMTLVKSAVGEDNEIEVVLQDSDRWIG